MRDGRRARRAEGEAAEVCNGHVLLNAASVPPNPPSSLVVF